VELPEAVVDAAAFPVPVAFVPCVSLLFNPTGCIRYINLELSEVRLLVLSRILDPATMGPISKARAMTSIRKYKTAYRQTRLFLSFDCFVE
jgi:hypothetical protein